MTDTQIDRDRGVRLKQAMVTRGHRKATAFAADLDISPAAITKWTQGHAMSIDHACTLAGAKSSISASAQAMFNISLSMVSAHSATSAASARTGERSR